MTLILIMLKSYSEIITLTGNRYKNMHVIYTWHCIDVILCLFCTHSTSQFALTTLQVLDSPRRSVATMVHRFVSGKSQEVGHVLPSSALCWWLAMLPAQEKAWDQSLQVLAHYSPPDHRRAGRIR